MEEQRELKDDTDRTPLSWAAQYGHGSIVQMLIEKDDVDINTKDIFGMTPLSAAAEMGHDAVARQLIQRGDVERIRMGRQIFYGQL